MELERGTAELYARHAFTQMLDVADRLAYFIQHPVGGRLRPQQGFEPGAQFRERGAQVVRDGVGDVPDTFDQLLDLVEHPASEPTMPRPKPSDRTVVGKQLVRLP